MSKDKSSKVRQRSFGTTMGVTSIIAILVILVLVVFSTLSLITAKADLNLSTKTSDNIEAYYKADANAEAAVAEFGDMIDADNMDDSKYEYENTGDGILLKFVEPVDKSRELKVEVLYNGDGSVKEKRLWQVSPVKEWEEDNQIQLYDPNQQ